MHKDYLLTLIDYNYWANGLIIKYADRLKPDDYMTETAHSQKSIHEILIHILFAEWVWRERLMGTSPDMAVISSYYRPEDYPDLDKILEKWFDEEMNMRDFVEKMPEGKLTETFCYKTTKGEELENVYFDIFTHMVFHGMQHRAEAATILHMHNRSPGDIDFLRYLRQR